MQDCCWQQPCILPYCTGTLFDAHSTALLADSHCAIVHIRLCTACVYSPLCSHLSVDYKLLASDDLPLLQVVSLHCALTDETKHLINTERLNMMKKDAVLVNASRGPVIDEVALVKHLQENPSFR